MTLTIELKPELEARLRDEAARQGVDLTAYVSRALEAHVHGTACRPPRLSREEANLLQQINLGVPPETWSRYQNLVGRRRAELLTPQEHQELIALSEQIEQANARRMDHLVELARLRGVSLDELMKQLGIPTPTPV